MRGYPLPVVVPVGRKTASLRVAGLSVAGWQILALLRSLPGDIAYFSGSIERHELAWLERTYPDRLRDIGMSSGPVESLLAALQTAVADRRSNGVLLLLEADLGLHSPEQVSRLIAQHDETSAAISYLGNVEDGSRDPTVVRNDLGEVVSISEGMTNEVATPLGAFIELSMLGPALRRVTPAGWRDGVRLPAALRHIVRTGIPVHKHGQVGEPGAISSLRQRRAFEQTLRETHRTELLDDGVVMPIPDMVHVDRTVTFGERVTLLPGSLIEGFTTVGNDCVIGPNSQLVDCRLGDGSTFPHSVARGFDLPEGSDVTPFSHLEESSNPARRYRPTLEG